MADDIVIWPSKLLNSPTEPVTDFGPALAELLLRMQDSVREADGIGIAANQIGVALRVALVGREDGTFFPICNPEILERTEDIELREGCLSVPNEFDVVKRFRKVRVKYQDAAGTWHEEVAEDRLAHVFQHEIDHLYGKVFVEHLSSLKRGLIRQKMTKLQKADLKKKAERSP